MSRVDAGYVAYLTRENAWLRARCTDLSSRLAEATTENAWLRTRLQLAALHADDENLDEDLDDDPPEAVP